MGAGWRRAALIAALSATCVLLVGSGSSVAAGVQPNDPAFAAAQAGLEQLHVPEAWNVVRCTSALTVAALDTGVTPAADFGSALASGYDAAFDDQDWSDDNGHGTRVASVFGAGLDNGIGVAGICGGARIVPVKIDEDSSGQAQGSDIAAGIDWAIQQHVKMIVLAYGPPPTSDTGAVLPALQRAIAAGISVVLAAGNGASSSAANKWAQADPAVIRVGGVDPNGSLNPRSNHGSWVDVAAPFTLPADGLDGSVETGAGTSIATAATAGVLGLLLTYKPDLTPAAAKQILVSSGTKQAGLDVGCGCIVDAYGALIAAGYRPPLTFHLATRGKGVVHALGTSCTGACALATTYLSPVVLHAVPAKGYRFQRWINACSAHVLTCMLTMRTLTPLSATAVFVKRPSAKKK